MLRSDWRKRVRELAKTTPIFTARQLHAAMYDSPGRASNALVLARKHGFEIVRIGPSGGPQRKWFKLAGEDGDFEI